MITTVAGLQVRCKKAGEGPPVIVLHGWGACLDTVAPILHCLSRRHMVFTVDLPGFGQSQQPGGVWGASEYARWVKDFMDAVGCSRADFVGHSFGGRVCIALAAAYPERVNRLVLIDSAGIRPPRTWRYRVRVGLFKALQAMVLFLPLRRWREAVFDGLRRVSGSSDYRDAGTMRGTLVRVVNEDLRPLLAAVQAPSLLIWGEQDAEVPLAHGRIMAAEMPRARLEVLPGAGHYSYLERLPKFCQLVSDFLE